MEENSLSFSQLPSLRDAALAILIFGAWLIVIAVNGVAAAGLWTPSGRKWFEPGTPRGS